MLIYLHTTWSRDHRPCLHMALQAPICGKSLEGTRTHPDTQVASESSDDGHSPRRAVCNCHCHVTVRNVCLWCAIVFLARRAAQTSRPYRTRYVCAQDRPAREETGKTSDAQPQPKIAVSIAIVICGPFFSSTGAWWARPLWERTVGTLVSCTFLFSPLPSQTHSLCSPC